jgi:hypothetical protein
MRRLRYTWLVATAVAVAALLVVGSAVAHPPRPTSRDQAVRDGCQRSDLGLGFDQSPEWVYVDRSPVTRAASGIVRIAHASLEDSILQHRSYDFNGNLVPDRAFRYLIAGSPSRHTNNYGPQESESHGRLHFEWESATIPMFAWPTDGDRATLWGSWIWDCGHWSTSENNQAGTVVGEHSELHPLSAIAVTRRESYRSARGERQTDVFISNEGDASHAIERCALHHHPVSATGYARYDDGFRPCARSAANRIQPLSRRYSFFVPAPVKPTPGARLEYHVVNRIARGSGSQRITAKPNGIQVTVTLRGAKHVVRYGKTFFVGWTGPARRSVALKVTVQSIRIRQADPNPSVPDPSGAHWSLYLDINGDWHLLNAWAPRLTTHVVDGERIEVNRTVKVYVPRRAGVSVLVQGRECDEPAGKTLFGLYANLLYPCPANTDEQNPNIFALFNNDDTGTILDIYRSSAAAIGRHVATSKATVTFPGSGPTSFGDHKMGQGDYQLTYSIRRG